LKGEKGAKGSSSETTAVVSGVSYTKWGSTKCRNGATLVYPGIVAGASANHQGGGSNKLCMPNYPQYSNFISNFHGDTYLFGTEYENNIRWSNNQYNAPCAVCYVSNKHTSIMYPARKSCPSGWTVEYSGYLMSEHQSTYRSMYVCVDASMEPIPGTMGNDAASHFYHVESVCDRVLQCPPYDRNKELTCVVCSK